MHIPAGWMKSPGMGRWKQWRGRRKAEGLRDGGERRESEEVGSGIVRGSCTGSPGVVGTKS